VGYAGAAAIDYSLQASGTPILTRRWGEETRRMGSSVGMITKSTAVSNLASAWFFGFGFSPHLVICLELFGVIRIPAGFLPPTSPDGLPTGKAARYRARLELFNWAGLRHRELILTVNPGARHQGGRADQQNIRC